MKYTNCLGLAAALLLAGCVEDVPTTPGLEQRVFSVLGGLEVGEVLQLTGADADTLLLPGAAGGSEFIVVPFFGSEAGNARLQVEVQGGRASLGDAAVGGGAPAGISAGLAGDPVRDHEQHIRRLEWERALFAQRLAGGRARTARALLNDRTAGRGSQAAVAVGDTIPVRVPNFLSNNLCTNFANRRARVAAVSARAIVATDANNPPTALTAADYQSIANEYEQFVYPITVKNFGEPTDIDRNGRVVILITSAINEQRPPSGGGIIVGTTFLGDLILPELGFNCASSNLGEIFYIIAPDPNAQLGRRISDRFVMQLTTTIVIHELQHLVNFGRRLYINDAEELEEVWLNEGLSHMSEELLFYEATPFEPRQNITRTALEAAGTDVYNRWVRFQSDNIVNYFEFLEHPADDALLAAQAPLSTRGAGWNFLRYTADQTEEEDSRFFYELVNSTIAGIPNVDRALDEDLEALPFMQSWSASVYADDQVQTAERFQQPSWNFRSLTRLITNSENFPLPVRELAASGQVRSTLEAGGAEYIRVAVEAGRQARVRVTSANATPPQTLRVSVIRVK